MRENWDQPTVELILKRACELAALPIGELRSNFVGFDCDEKSSKRDEKLTTAGMTRGKLIEGILDLEFDIY